MLGSGQLLVQCAPDLRSFVWAWVTVLSAPKLARSRQSTQLVHCSEVLLHHALPIYLWRQESHPDLKAGWLRVDSAVHPLRAALPRNPAFNYVGLRPTPCPVCTRPTKFCMGMGHCTLRSEARTVAAIYTAGTLLRGAVTPRSSDLPVETRIAP